MTVVEPSGDPIQEVLEREAAQRKRVFLAFVTLSLVPIAIGAYALAKAPAETTKIASDVAPLVSERVAKDVITRTEPLIRQNVLNAIASTNAQIAAIPELRTEVAALGQTIGRTTGAFDELRAVQNTLRQEVETQRGVAAGLAGDVAGINGRIERERTDVTALRTLANRGVQVANANQEALASVNRRLAAMDQTLKDLNDRVAVIEKRLQVVPR